MSKAKQPESAKVMTPLGILLACCSDKGGTRFFMKEPFVVGDFVYATNGHIVAKAPQDAVSDIHYWDRSDFPPVDKIFPEPCGPDLELPAIKPAKSTPCESCNEDGECYCTCGDQHKCCKCGGTGFVMERAEPVRIGELCLGSNYVRILHSFGVTHIRATGTDNKHPVFWKAGIVEGRLMQYDPR